MLSVEPLHVVLPALCVPIDCGTGWLLLLRTALCLFSYLWHANVMELNGAVKVHLEGLGKEIDTLIGHSKHGKGDTYSPTCWSKNSEDVDVALRVIGAVSSARGWMGGVKLGQLRCLFDCRTAWMPHMPSSLALS